MQVDDGTCFFFPVLAKSFEERTQSTKNTLRLQPAVASLSNSFADFGSRKHACVRACVGRAAWNHSGNCLPRLPSVIVLFYFPQLLFFFFFFFPDQSRNATVCPVVSD